MTSLNIVVCVSAAAGSAAIAQDLIERRISNWISGGLFAAGIAQHAGAEGWRGVRTALLGAVTGFAVFLLFYALNGMGGGDLKLLSGFGSLLGPAAILRTALLAAALGGLTALAWLGVSAARRAPRPESVPYAPAIVIGAWLTLLARA